MLCSRVSSKPISFNYKPRGLNQLTGVGLYASTTEPWPDNATYTRCPADTVKLHRLGFSPPAIASTESSALLADGVAKLVAFKFGSCPTAATRVLTAAAMQIEKTSTDTCGTKA